MIPSFTGVFTLLACLALPLLRLREALMLVASASFLGTYAIGSDDGVHVLPGPLLAVCYCAWLAVRLLFKGLWQVPPFPGKRLFVPFLAYAALITIAAPILFGGRILVIQPGQVSEGIRQATPLQWSSSSVAQLAYLVFDAVLLCAAVRAMQRPGLRIGWPVRVFLVLATAFAVGVGLEAVLAFAGWPVDLFGFVMGPEFGEFRDDRYALGDVLGLPIRRAQAVFGEPSFYSVFMTGAAGAALVLARARPSRATVGRVALVSVALLLSLSTTAVVAFALTMVMAVLVPIDAKPAAAGAPGSGRRRTLFLVGFALLAVVLVVALLQSDTIFNYLFGKLTDTEGYEDGNYSSGAERLFWDVTAAVAMLDSYGVGIGAGATRASSFLLNTGASYGLPGLLLLGVCVGLLLRALYRRAPFPEDANVRAAIVMWLGWFIALAFSVPDGFSLFYIWIQLGFVLAVLARERWAMPSWPALSRRRGRRLET